MLVGAQMSFSYRKYLLEDSDLRKQWAGCYSKYMPTFPGSTLRQQLSKKKNQIKKGGKVVVYLIPEQLHYSYLVLYRYKRKLTAHIARKSDVLDQQYNPNMLFRYHKL